MKKVIQNNSVFSISQINEYVKLTLERNDVLSNVWLRGEISNFKNQYSTGHLYLSLKDGDSMIKAVMFRGYAQKLGFIPRDGDKVIVHGKISVYSARGEYQVYIDEMQPDGIGLLAQAYERLKQKLSSEGLFDASHKKPIPENPVRVGVITSASGAAIHDILNVSGRRAAGVEIVIFPALVQGESAPRSLSSGIRYFNNVSPVDVIIIGRGGGSIEDLWGFNDEGLAREIFASRIPVVSAVGHETDFTICDFVSDMRAPTPSAAAELVFPNTAERIGKISAMGDTLEAKMQKKLRDSKYSLLNLSRNLELRSPMRMLSDKNMRVSLLAERLEGAMDKKIESSKNRLAICSAKLGSQNPLAVLSRGYALVENEDNTVISSSKELICGDNIRLVFADGEVRATVK